MMNESEIDVLHICTPLASHFSIASAAIARGVHVIIEKPMTPTLDETGRLYDLASRHKVLVCPVHQFLFQAGAREAHSRLPEIGRLLHLETTFCSAGASNLGEDLQTAVVGEILPHPLSLMDFFLPGSLEAGEWTRVNAGRGEFLATKVSNGTSVSVLISMNSRPTVCSMRLLGTQGTIHVDFFHGFCVVENGRVSRTAKILHPFSLALGILAKASANLATRALSLDAAYPGLNTLIRLFYDAVRNGAAAPISPQQALNVAKVRDFLLQYKGAGQD